MSGGVRTSAPVGPEGRVSYRLAKQRLVDSFTRGERSLEEVCDAQPELRRVAHSFGRPVDEPCPICEADQLVTVTFAFGSGLPKSGRVLGTLSEVRKLRKRGKPTACYVIETCRSCWWNHLRETYELSGS